MLVPEIDEPERILAYGAAGTGKSKGAIDIAKATGAKMWVVDTDAAWKRMLARERGLDVQLCDVRRVAKREGQSEWKVMTEALDQYSEQMGSNDLLVVDLVGPAWAWAQVAFTTKTYGQEIDDFFLEARKKQVESGSRGGSPFDGMQDWPTINRMYDERVVDPILLAEGHVYICAEQQELMVSDKGTMESQATVADFGWVGWKPKGQKGNPHIVSTVLWMHRTIKGDFAITQVKDRDRERTLNGVKWTNLADTYLKGPGGWMNEAVARAKAKKEEA